jgi:tetratricopeptide (TPR) repeat protein
MSRKKEHTRNLSSGKKQPKAFQVVDLNKWKSYRVLGIILLISIVAYLPIFRNGLLAWDDQHYIINYNLIKDLSWNGIKAIFDNFSSDIYAPLTDLIKAVEYKISGLNPEVFHLGSLVFHLLNIVLVFWFIKLLCNRRDIAAFTALFFGIHPIQVESVAWAAAGTNLHCAAFFLGSLIAYLYYIRHRQNLYFFISLFLFMLSLLSKAVAVVLPIVLILIDYYKGRKITIINLLEKLPYLLLSLAAGILAFLLKNNAGSLGEVTVYHFPQRLVFASYGFISYLFKLLFPLNLSAFYPYPVRGVDIPIQYYAYFLLFLGLAAYTIYSHRFTKKITFGIGFFTITVLLVLQLFPVGSAIMADRYSYIPSIGIFYLAGEGFLFMRGKKLKIPAFILLSLFAVLFTFKTYARCGVWKNDLTLWNDVIDQDKTVEVAYNNRGVVFFKENRNDLAIKDFTKGIQLNPVNWNAYYNRGNAFANESKNAEAVSDFTSAIRLKPDYFEAYFNRGNAFANESKNDEAVSDFTRAINLKPDYIEAYNNRGIVFTDEKRNDGAIKDFTKVIQLNAGNWNAFYNRGNAFANESKYNEAVGDFTGAIKLKPDYIEAYTNRGIIFFNEKRNEESIKDFTRVIQLDPGNWNAYYNRGMVFQNMKRNDEANKDFSKAMELKNQSESAKK